MTIFNIITLFGGLALGLCLFGSSLGLGQIIDELSLDLNDLLIGLGHLAGILGSLGGRGSSLDLGLLRSKVPLQKKS